MTEPIIPPDLTDTEAMQVYLHQLHEWIKSIQEDKKDDKEN